MIKPREVANKSVPGNLEKAIEMALSVESDAVRRNTQTFNSNRYITTGKMEDYEQLKDKARKLKEEAIENLPVLLETLEASINKNGGHFYIAGNAKDACDYILQICRLHEAKVVVKGKSITSEEIKLNHVLEGAGIEVNETDLAEFILQYSDEQPSHIVGPAIHQSRERISKLFIEKFNPGVPLETGEQLTKFARAKLRDKFLTADIGITGANFIAADTGSVALVESEGNIRLCYTLPPVHIALAGIEKVLPSLKDIGTLIELLAPSGTGQPLTSYTSIIKPPLNLPLFSFNGKENNKREFYLVLIDNGRFRMRNDPELREALYCIRCGACLNSCANFQSVGGHAFGGETYSGGIGGAWEAGTGKLENALFSELCTGCSRCVPQCPVKIDIPWLNQVLHHRLNEKEGLNHFVKWFMPQDLAGEKSDLQKLFLGSFHHFAVIGAHFPVFINFMQRLAFVRTVMEKLLGISEKRKLPAFASETLIEQYNNFEIAECLKKYTVLMFTDTYTNYLYPERGKALFTLFNTLGINLIMSKVIDEGRAALSQGQIITAKLRAQKTAEYFEHWIKKDYDIIVTEPSSLAMFRRDYKNLLNEELYTKIKAHCYDPIEYLHKFITANNVDIAQIFDISKLPSGTIIFYHGHCQQKTVGASDQTVELLNKLQLNVITSKVECCGMAGSFGYKKLFYNLSMNNAEDLFNQIKASGSSSDVIVLTSGISCRDQISEGLGYKVIHPAELLVKILK